MRECREVSGRSQAFIVFISVFVMKINYTKIGNKQIYENKFLFLACTLSREGACHVFPSELFRMAGVRTLATAPHSGQQRG
ncbi:hypothetical protein BKM03_26905 [Pseudomonas avellanae]|uniref:Uncharacterized protein n=1 Tax=Pseudomonas avellanae TaxID=46257 RepID=A0AAD0GSJ5_9PSED|nr:hypothetical protein BKM03_26905 [Pseudomonas avellanae]POP87587.1 hypothetical protein CXB34_07030 [Pseudomonas amygdali pv. morsprunorum]